MLTFNTWNHLQKRQFIRRCSHDYFAANVLQTLGSGLGDTQRGEKKKDRLQAAEEERGTYSNPAWLYVNPLTSEN